MQAEFDAYLAEARQDVLNEIRRLAAAGSRHGAALYELMLEYPMRPAKGLRPALCFAVCGAFGASRDTALQSATALELYHNAFLIHDDIEDASERRRHEPTLHVEHGMPIALHVGDGMLALTLEPLLANTETIGLARALRVLRICARMARESAEGQMMELGWIREGRWDLHERDYVRMVYKKTAWYTFLAPTLVGAALTNASIERTRALARFATLLGVAFQVADDLLDVVGDEAVVGKRSCSDLWEGKRTLCLLHALHHVSPTEQAELVALLERPRPPTDRDREAEIERLLERATADEHERDTLRRRVLGPPRRTRGDVERLWAAMDSVGSFVHARNFARRRAASAAAALKHACIDLPKSEHRRFLEALVTFTIERCR